MTTIEINETLSKSKIKTVVDVLRALGIDAVITNEESYNPKFTKENFIRKIENARKSKKIKVSASEQSSFLGV